MGDDIEEMERMLNEYLEFAQYQKSEKTKLMNFNYVIKDIVKKYEGKQINLFLEESPEIDIRPNSMKRCLI